MKRRRLIFLIVILALISGCARVPVYTLSGRTMGTFYTIKVCSVFDGGEQDLIRTTVDSALSRVNGCMNRYDPKSEISRFNAYFGTDPFPVSAPFIKVALLAEKIYRASDGAFDPTVTPLVRLWGFGDDGALQRPDPETLASAMRHVGMDRVRISDGRIRKTDPETSLDFSAIAKGYGVDEVAEALLSLGYRDILVEIGGEVRACGDNAGRPWRIGIADPAPEKAEERSFPATIVLRDKACATSGDYRQFYQVDGKRYSHLIDPKTGHPIEHELTSVTVIAETCMLADAAATAAIVLGKVRGEAFIESLEGVEAYFIYREGDELRTAETSAWNAYREISQDQGKK